MTRKRVLNQSKRAVELTIRQKAFLYKLLDVCQEMQTPLHYSVIAERLGVSSSTAYDMLRLLEQKGMVSSEYATPKATSGPGRSSIHFAPTAKAIDLVFRLSGENEEQEGWKDIKAHILAGISQGKAAEYNDLFRELLTLIPEAKSALVYCAEVITALLITLRETRNKFGRRSPVSRLLGTNVTKLGMSILAGLAFGLCLADREVQERLSGFQQHMKKYEKSLGDLSPENLIVLHRFTGDVWKALKGLPGQ